MFCRNKFYVLPAQIATLILLLLHDAPFKRTFTVSLLNRYSRLLRLSEELPSIANFLDRITVHVFNKQVSTCAVSVDRSS